MNIFELSGALGARMRHYPVESALATLLLILVVYILVFAPPAEKPGTAVLTLEQGTSVTKAAQILKAESALRSATAFILLVRAMNASGGVVAGTYSIPEGENVFSLAYRFAHGTTGIPPAKVTVPEGYSSREIGLLLKEKLTPFDGERFVSLAKGHEGYLFPDTYLLPPGASPESIIATMLKNFDAHIAPLAPDIAASGRTLGEVVTMASLVEKEARLDETRRIVAGILWKRLDRGMPLQVDAVFGYIMGTTTFSPSFRDLGASSPYNTYTNKGLPPGPITNPGLESIQAVLTPIATPYFYYLTGSDGTMHYAKTLAEHVANRKYLK